MSAVSVVPRPAILPLRLAGFSRPPGTHLDFVRRARWLSIAARVLLGFSIAQPAFSQSNADGFIYGSVSGDAAELVNTTVVARNKDTGVEREVRLSSDGVYRIAALPIGVYDVILRQPNRLEQVRSDVAVRLGLGVPVRFTLQPESTSDVVKLDEYLVQDTAIVPVSTAYPESMMLLRESMLDDLPVIRDVRGVALLAPGAVQGETMFDLFNLQSLVSFGGASVAENAYYINGFNVTSFRNGLGGSTVPFAFYDEFQIKAGGYGAEFGRSTGGVINATTKRGGNAFHGGVSVYYAPAEWRARQPDVFLPDGSPVLVNREDRLSNVETNVHLSGPLLKNRVFFYGLYNFRRVREDGLHSGGSQLTRGRDDDPFWGAKLDVQLTDEHLIELTAFSDERDRVDTSYRYDASTSARGESVGRMHFRRGGQSFIARYTGELSDDVTISALHGRGEYDLTTIGDNADAPAIYDENLKPLGSWTNIINSEARDERAAWRADAAIRLGRHHLRLGWETERNESFDLTQFSGGVFWQYFTVPPSRIIAGNPVPDGIDLVVKESIYSTSGTFPTRQEAWYVEDAVSLWNDRLSIRAGLRSEAFKNMNKLGETFVRVGDQVVPRLGFALTLGQERRARIFGSLGRYHIPIPAHTNVHFGGGELLTEEFYTVTSRNPDGTPNKGAALGDKVVYHDGSIRDYRTQTHLDLKPMAQDELILGYQADVGTHWSVTVRGIYRDLHSAIEDIGINGALESYAARHGIAGYEDDGVGHYVLGNPGSDIRMFWDLNGDGALEQIVLSNELDLHLDRARRRYYAVEFLVERRFADGWYFHGSYTWSQSYGNLEGYVRSDLLQGEAAITAAFDLPELGINAGGWLPNDRRHMFKAFGAYQLTPKLQLGANAVLQSGRPLNAFGNNPMANTPAYNGSFFEVPQGSAGRTPWLFNVDLAFTYRATENLKFGLDIFNVLGRERHTQVYETRTDAAGALDPRYKLPRDFQAPRAVRVSAAWEF